MGASGHGAPVRRGFRGEELSGAGGPVHTQKGTGGPRTARPEKCEVMFYGLR